MELSGKLSNLAVFGSWAKALLTTRDGLTVQVVGRALVGLNEKREYLLRGRNRHHPQFGLQFEVDVATLDVSVSRDRLVAELETAYAGCGEKTARRIISNFEGREGGLALLAEILTSRPWELEAADLSGKKLLHIGGNNLTPEVKLARTLEARLVGVRLERAVLNKLMFWIGQLVGLVAPGSEAMGLQLLAQDPFRPMLSIEGYGFFEAEAVGRALETDWHSRQRMGAIAYEAIRSLSERAGHSYITIEQYQDAVARLDQRLSPLDCLGAAGDFEYPVVRTGQRLYLTAAFKAEQTVANGFLRMLGDGRPLWPGSKDSLCARLKHIEQDVGKELDESQRRAILGILTSKKSLHTLTAGPGCGKTTVMEMVAALVRDVSFAAPTGIAAKVLDARVSKYGQVALTVHAMLESTGDGFGKSRNNPLITDLVVIDEAGMQDLITCAALIDAMLEGTHLLLVGDVDQMESVGAGRVLADAVDLESADHHVLTEPHRAGKSILKFIRGLRDGHVDSTCTDGTVVLKGYDDNSDLNFEAITDLWLQTVSRRGLEGVALLFGYRKGSKEKVGTNVTYANHALQNLVNAETEENRIPGSSLRKEDRVIVRKRIVLKRKVLNGPDEVYSRLVNGDTGYVRSFKTTGDGRLDSIQLRMDDGRDVDLPAIYARKIDLGYAQTVHSAQGSEYDEVIFFARGRGSEFLNRKLLYTGASRAKKRITVIGRRDELESVVRYVAAKRQSGVCHEVDNRK
jgi:exodeoxyribonuclease V alpha subunit